MISKIDRLVRTFLLGAGFISILFLMKMSFDESVRHPDYLVASVLVFCAIFTIFFLDTIDKYNK